MRVAEEEMEEKGRIMECVDGYTWEEFSEMLK